MAQSEELENNVLDNVAKSLNVIADTIKDFSK